MDSGSQVLEAAMDGMMETLPSVWNRIRANIRAAATSRFGITLEQFHTLRHIRRGYRTVKDLADKRQISRPAISQSIHVLVGKGLVTRTRESGDRRLVRLDLTPYANRILEENLRETRDWMRREMAGLRADELESVQAAMSILRKTFAPEIDG